MKAPKLAEKNPSRSPLPWWTWFLPFFVANLGTWLSIWFKTDPGTSLWYLPTAFGIVMTYWWGPRALLGVYLNAVLCAPLWDLPRQNSFLYALPETLEIGLSWLLFIKLARGKYWLPDLKNVGSFLLFGSLVPTFIANAYLVLQLYLLGDISLVSLWNNWMTLISADLATQFVFAVPVLVLFTRPVMERGWTERRDDIPELPLLPGDRNGLPDKVFLFIVFLVFLITIVLFPVHELRGVFGLLMMFVAIRYGMNMAIMSSTWVGLLVFILPVALRGNWGLSTASNSDFLTANFDILFLCGVTLVTGRAISDLLTEVNRHEQYEGNLRTAEVKYRTLIEKIPPIIYITGLQQHIGVNYISPRIISLGYTQDEWVADPELWFKRVHPEDQGRVKADIQQSIDTGEPFRSEYRIIAHDGSVRWLLDEAVDIFDEAGAPIFRQGFMLDITPRKQAEESLASRERYLELLNEMTRAILLSQDFEATLQTLAVNMAKLVHADDCYIARWDEEIQKVIPVATTISYHVERPYPSYRDAPSEDLKLALATLNMSQVIAVDDVYDSPHVKVDFVKRYPVRSALGVPLIAGGHKLGAAIIVFNTPHKFTQVEIGQAEQAGNQVALALWNFQQGVEIQQRLKESNVLAKISQALSKSEHIGTGKVLQLIVDSACELIPNAEKSVVHLLDTDKQSLTAQAVSGFDDQEKRTRHVKMRLGEGISGRAMREGVTMNVGDVKNDPHFIAADPSAKFNSLLVVPVQGGDRRIGTISVESHKLNAFTNRDAELLNALALQATIAIENTHLFETTQKSLKEVNILYKISRELAASLDADQLNRETISLLQQIFGYYHVQIYLIDPETGNLVVKYGSGDIGNELVQQGHHLSPGEGIAGHVTETGEPFLSNNVDDVNFFKRNPLLAQTQSEMAIPVKIEQKVVGVLDIQQIPPHRFTDSDLQLMSAIADQLAVVLQKANLYSTLQAALQQEQIVRSQLVQSERLALVGRLLASVSHELSNPLQIMQYALSLLKEDDSLSPAGRQDLDVVLSEAERMAALFERLRSAYRPVQMMDFQRVSLNSVIEDVHTLISPHMRQKEIVFEFLPEASLPDVSGLTDQLRQVLLNLFLNAIEVMKPGGRISVLTRGLLQQNEVLLTIKDTGPGVDPAILPNIFDAFITNKETGTGLGLTITHDIIQQHHGRIAAENDPQGGAVFHIWLPIFTGGEQ